MDVLTPSQRSKCMSAIKGKNTRPELIVRSMLHRLGFRFRLHRRDLPGTPDIVLPKHRAVIFVHGCFWHMHKCRYGTVKPSTHAEFWRAKREGTVRRDKSHIEDLRKQGWRVLTVWECEIPDIKPLEKRIVHFLSYGTRPLINADER
jgi:DNA mismatch endonuclease (patch repair protein)